MIEQENQQIEPPKEIAARLNEWHRLYTTANRVHYILGISGVLASSLAASNPNITIFSSYPISQLLSALAAAMKFRYGLINESDLFLALEKSELRIEDSEKSIY